MIARIFAALLLFSAFLADARTASGFFASAPDNVIRLLPQSTRLDMLDYFNYGSSRSSENQFGGQSRILRLSDRLVELEVDSSVSMQIVMLPAKADTLIAVVTTLSLPFADSSMAFYTSDWKQLKNPPLVIPEFKAWLTPEGAKNIDNIAPFLPFIPVKASFDENAAVLTLTNMASEYLSAQNAREFSPWLLDTKTYDISDGHFLLRK